MMRTALTVAALLTALDLRPAAVARGQTAADRSLRFDVVSIKTSREARPRGTPLEGGRVSMTGMTLRDLLVAAYQVHASQLVGGPSWMTPARFDIIAVIENPPSSSAEVRQQLLRALLAERFALRVHNELREMQACALRRARPGEPLPRGLQASLSSCDGVTEGERRANTRDGWPPCGMARIANTPDPGGRGETTRQMRSALTMEQFAAALIPLLAEPVSNETGLSGRFDIEIEFVRPLPGGLPGDVPEGPTLTAALEEQLGLRVERRRARVPVLVIDAATLPVVD
jgi:uncharacterized protein (TIGR03435 family)